MRPTYSIVVAAPQTTEGIPVALVSLEDAQAVAGDTEDAVLEAQITSASMVIATLLDRELGIADIVETFVSGSDKPTALRLSRYPVVAIESVTVEGGEITEFEVNPTSGLLYRIGGGEWNGRVVVTYSGGYQLPEQAPKALATACLAYISGGLSEATGDANIRSIQHEGVSVSYGTASSGVSVGSIDGAIENLIAPFRRVSF